MYLTSAYFTGLVNNAELLSIRVSPPLVVTAITHRATLSWHPPRVGAFNPAEAVQAPTVNSTFLQRSNFHHRLIFSRF